MVGLSLRRRIRHQGNHVGDLIDRAPGSKDPREEGGVPRVRLGPELRLGHQLHLGVRDGEARKEATVLAVFVCPNFLSV